MKNTLKSLNLKIPNIIEKIESIQEEIDRHHSNVNKATIAGSVAGIVGGGLFIGGLIAAPFTFGASLGLTIVGTGIGAAGGMTTAGAKYYDYQQSSNNNNAVRSLLDTVESLCKKAQNQYTNVERCCSEISDILTSNNSSLHAKTTQEKFMMGYNVVSFLFTPHYAAATVTKNIVQGISRGTEAAATGFRALSIGMKAVSGVFAALGIIADVYCLGKSIKELVTDQKCQVSESISKQIVNLRNLQDKITQFLDSL